VAETLVKVVLPELGESVAEGSVTGWRKRVGDAVTEGEALVDVTTDKVDVEIPSPVSGTLKSILVQAGQSVGVGAPLAEIDATAPPPQAAEPKAAQAKPAPAQPAAAQARTISPMIRRIAARRGVDLNNVAGSGPGGRVTAPDVLGAKPDGKQPAAPAAQPAASAAQPAAPTTLKGPAAALVNAMEESLSVPTATSFRTIGVDVLDIRRRHLNEALKRTQRPERISYTHVIAFAIARAARDVPAMSANFARTHDGPQRVNRGVHLGLAVDTLRKDGARFLVVPVIRDADRLDFKSFHARYEDLVAKARAGELKPDDLSGATLALTNPGAIGTVASIPRLMAGQGTIVATGAIGFPPGFANLEEATLRGLGIGKVMTLTSTYDHRVIQGAESGEFLRRIDQLLAGVERFYESIGAGLGLALDASAAPQPQTPTPGLPGAQQPVSARQAQDALRDGAAAMALVVRYRTFGHTAADIDPLSKPDGGDPALDPASLGLTRELLAAIPATTLRVYVPGTNLAEVFDNLRRTYAGTMAYEIEHIANHEQRNWLREQIETGAHRKPLSAEQRLALLNSLIAVEAFERFLRRTYLGSKTFSIEGLDSMVPMLERIVSLLADDGVGEIDVGMAHRGRLSVIAHVVGRPVDELLREFEHADRRPVINADVTGDVKYHQGARGTRSLSGERKIEVHLAHNPSHLEAVDSVVEGHARAAQTDRTTNLATQHLRRAAPVLIHGDAAFSGQGTVAEVLNLESLPGYNTGGTLHVIADNQIGFTTVPGDARSTRYASDLAKGFDVPIIHVNADDVEACVAAAQLAVDFRRRFKRDVVIDLIGYRRFGHNEADEPAYTLPLMYESIKTHPTAREIYAGRLLEAGIATEADVKQRMDAAQRQLSEALARVKADADGKPNGVIGSVAPGETAARAGVSPVETGVTADTLRSLNERLLALPPNFSVHPKLVRQIERRRAALGKDGEIDWGLAESLAFASLLLDGRPIRLTGQDTERGTFSHRHLAFYDANTGERFVPLQNLDGARASFEVYNSPLSEYAALGFEYGYSASAPDALVLWEAQFGDFVNGAEIIVDQFIASGMAKWGQTSRLVLLLPHAYEGAGPEHSSARLERFLQLAAEDNFRIANCSTPAQYFHLLRDQALAPRARPLIVMTPKSLLRLKAASSTVGQLASGAFAKIIDDPKVTDRTAIARVILCSGKIYYDLIADAARVKQGDLAIVRVELLEPFPLDDVLNLIGSYPKAGRVTWVQEEPNNQGARAFVVRRLRERLLPKSIAFDYVGRPDRASTSEGYPGAHDAEQARIVAQALSGAR